MRIAELFGHGRPVFSFEFFPPKTDEAAQALLREVRDLREMLAPDFVSVTYGAGGTTRGRTIELVSRMQSELGLTTMAHLTCAGHTQAELDGLLDRLASRGIRNVLALRGDAPGGGKFAPAPGGLAHASELAELVRARGRFCVGGACYPETHPEAASADEDLRWAKHKIACGAEFLITQLFFDNEDYFQFVDRAREAGIAVPIVPGLMPITSVSQIERFTKMCGAKIPPELRERLKRYEEDASVVMAIGIEHAIRQARRLLEAGAPGVHFYTLNKSHATRSILAAVKAL
ncbi:MAG TPA: methylenetetrahydrofolate reductase [NAD(P)H] [Planctomycetota bacterium]